MANLVRCVCKSHCRRFNPDTLSFEGDGAMVSKSTAHNHRIDDQMAQGLDSFAGNVAARVLQSSPPTELLEPDPPVEIPDEAAVLEMELTYRSAWTPTDRPLAFVSAPPPDCKYQYPPVDELHLCNRGPYALESRNRANEVYLENESRLCEILLRLWKLPSTEGTREQLESKAREGLLRMRRHKEMEWERQRTCSIARKYGHTVVDTGTSSSISGRSSQCLNDERPLLPRITTHQSNPVGFYSHHSPSSLIFPNTKTGNCSPDCWYQMCIAGLASTQTDSRSNPQRPKDHRGQPGLGPTNHVLPTVSPLLRTLLIPGVGGFHSL